MISKKIISILQIKRLTILATLIIAVNSCSIFKTEEILKFSKVNTFAGMNKEFGEPFGIAVKDSDVYVSDGENGKIFVFSKDGKSKVLTDKLDTPSQLAFDEKGDLIVADSGTHTIKKVLSDGRIELVAGVENKKGFEDGDAKSALFNAPIGLAFFENKIFVADTYNDKIRVIENGKVSTLAGSEQGFADGKEAKFNTPTNLAVWTDGKILVADSLNRRIRVVEKDGKTWTLSGNGKADLKNGLLNEAEFVQPTALTIDKFGSIYVADGNTIRVIGRKMIPVVETISNTEDGFFDGKLKHSRFNRPSGLAFDEDNNLFVADAENQLVRVFTDKDFGKKTSVAEFDKIQFTAEEFRKMGEPRWTYEPPEKKREIAGTVGELRGTTEKGILRFHNGLDIVGGYGETARFIRDEKVLRPNAVYGFETLRESIRMPTLGYVHIRLGRDAEQKPFDDERFQFSFNDDDKPKNVRIPRGTKFKAGDAIGTLNRFNHVHLIAGRTGRELNALDALILPDIADEKSPSIEKVWFYDQDWNEFETENSSERITLDGKVRIVVESYDQMDGNAERRRLGLHKIGYQVLDENENPLEDFKEPKWTIDFNKTPEDSAAKLVFAKGSQADGEGETIFRYIATNEVSGRTSKENFFDVSKLKQGSYILKVLTADFFGNVASKEIEFIKE